MTDTRFTTAFDDLDGLLFLLDVDEQGDVETLLIFLFDRPIQVDEVWDDSGGTVSLDVIVRGSGGSVEAAYEFPMSVIEFVRACADTAADAGPYTGEGASPPEQTPDVLAMDDAALITALQDALGKVRIFNLTYSEEE